MSMALQSRVANLEQEVKALRDLVSALTPSAPKSAPEARPRNPNGPRQMCPKCNEQPNYYLHTKNCKGPKGTI